MPKSEQSLNELLYDLKRIEEHREILSENKIRKIYKSLMKELNAFIAEEYFLYADGEGVLSYATLQEKARKARFLEEVVRQVDSITPELKAEMMKLVEETYTNCYQGMQNAVINASNTQELAAVMSDTTLRPEVLKQAVSNNISKLTLPNVLEKHRQEIVYNIKQELTIGMINGDRYEQMARRITDKVDISYNKAMNIARTESHRNIESGLFDCAENISQGVEGSGLVYVAIWRTMKDERVRPNVRRKTKKGWKTYKSTNGADHVSMEGKTIRVGDFFEFSDGVKTKCPSKSGVARHDCNCRCFLEYDVMTEEEFARANTNVKTTVAQTKAEQQLELSDFPTEFTEGAEGKNTKKLIDYVNSVDGADANVVQLYKSMGSLDNIGSKGVPFKITHGSNCQISYSTSRATGELAQVKCVIPKLSGENLAGQVGTTLHEEMHLIDLYARTGKGYTLSFGSGCFEPLVNAVSEIDAEIGTDIKLLFENHKKELKVIENNIRNKYRIKESELLDRYFPDGAYLDDLTKSKQYDKEFKKLRKAMSTEIDYEQRNALGGNICNLEDIYDALSGGKFREKGVVTYGHGQRYYSTTSARIEEIIANYASLSVTRPDLVEMLRKDKPELCEALDKYIIELLKKVGK